METASGAGGAVPGPEPDRLRPLFLGCRDARGGSNRRCGSEVALQHQLEGAG
jgi:hypothetical protein